jgi:hypothetical protein
MLLRGWRPPLARQAPELGSESIGRTYRDLARGRAHLGQRVALT